MTEENNVPNTPQRTPREATVAVFFGAVFLIAAVTAIVALLTSI
ncbi:MAG: hypothetical protein RIS75_717 [Actinomycetota bacterium]